MDMTTAAVAASIDEATLARKRRRMVMRKRSLSSSSSPLPADPQEIVPHAVTSSSSSSTLTDDDSSVVVVVVEENNNDDEQSLPPQVIHKRKKPHITGIKRQSRYDPGVSMTKDELKTWRKEARRVRNRESAAASRKKIRETTTILESQLKDAKSKYTAALRYILTLEAAAREVGSSSSSTVCPSAVLRQDIQDLKNTTSPLPPPPLTTTTTGNTSEHKSVVSRTTTTTLSVDGEDVCAVSPSYNNNPMKDDRPPREVALQPSIQQQIFNDREDIHTLLPYPLSDRSCPSPFTSLISQQHIIDTMISRPIACV